MATLIATKSKPYLPAFGDEPSLKSGIDADPGGPGLARISIQVGGMSRVYPPSLGTSQRYPGNFFPRVANAAL